MKKKSFGSALIGLGVFISLSSAIYAKEESTKFFINGRESEDAGIVMMNDTTYVPLRLVGQELGAQVAYDSKNKSVVVTKGNQLLKVNIGEREGILNEEKFTLENQIILHKDEKGQQLAYVPLRNIFEIFDGIVSYNKEYHYVNAYNSEHITYKALQGLKSDDLTTYRFAQLALPQLVSPQIMEENMCIGGGRSVKYIFPLNKKTNYFFMRSDPSGDLDISSIAYMEIENGVAVCKWYKELSGDVSEHINKQDNAINWDLGARGIVREIGEFPTIEETHFIGFQQNYMAQPDPDQEIASFRETFCSRVSILSPKGSEIVPEHLIGDISRSPYISNYKDSDYTYYYNDEIMAKVDEAKIPVK